MCPALPFFKEQPDELKDFTPEIRGWLESVGLQSIDVNGLFDLLITKTADAVDKYLELKVCLKSQSWAIPISKKQWLFIDEYPEMLEKKASVLIYGADCGVYSLCTYSDLAEGLAGDHNDSTTYIRAATFMNYNLEWYLPKDAAEVLYRWLNDA